VVVSVAAWWDVVLFWWLFSCFCCLMSLVFFLFVFNVSGDDIDDKDDVGVDVGVWCLKFLNCFYLGCCWRLCWCVLLVVVVVCCCWWCVSGFFVCVGIGVCLVFCFVSFVNDF